MVRTPRIWKVQSRYFLGDTIVAPYSATVLLIIMLRIIFIQALQYLKKVCNHPALVLQNSKHPKHEKITKDCKNQGKSITSIEHSAKLTALKLVQLQTISCHWCNCAISRISDAYAHVSMSWLSLVVAMLLLLMYCVVGWYSSNLGATISGSCCWTVVSVWLLPVEREQSTVSSISTGRSSSVNSRWWSTSLRTSCSSKPSFYLYLWAPIYYSICICKHPQVCNCEHEFLVCHVNLLVCGA